MNKNENKNSLLKNSLFPLLIMKCKFNVKFIKNTVNLLLLKLIGLRVFRMFKCKNKVKFFDRKSTQWIIWLILINGLSIKWSIANENVSNMKNHSSITFDKQEEQTNDDFENEKINNKDDNVIVVTGSTLISNPAELTRETRIVTREEILQTGATRLADFLLTLPQNINAPTTIAAGDLDVAARFGRAENEFGDTGINLRGLGEEYTLVLIDGLRPARAGLFGEAFDISTYPLERIDRIEIIFDNAVAIYGPDAIGGVLNIITRKDYEGYNFSLSASITDASGGERYDANLGKTFNWDSGSLTLDASVQVEKKIDGSARDINFRGSAALTRNPVTNEFIGAGSVIRPNVIADSRASGLAVPLFYVRDIDGDGRTDNQALNERLPAFYYDIDRKIATGAFLSEDETEIARLLNEYDSVNGVTSSSTTGELRDFLNRGVDNLGSDRTFGIGRVQRIGLPNTQAIPAFLAAQNDYTGYYPVYAVAMPEQLADMENISLYDFQENLREDENGNQIAPLPSASLDFNNADDVIEINRLMSARFPTVANTFEPQRGISLAPNTNQVSASISLSQEITDNMRLSLSYTHTRREQEIEFDNSLRKIPVGTSGTLDFYQRRIPFHVAQLQFSDEGFVPTQRPTDVRIDALSFGLNYNFLDDWNLNINGSTNKRDSEALFLNELRVGSDTRNNARFLPPGVGLPATGVFDEDGNPFTTDEEGNPLLSRFGQPLARIRFPGERENDFLWWLPGFSREGNIGAYAENFSIPNRFSFTDSRNNNFNISLNGSLFSLPHGKVRSNFNYSTSSDLVETWSSRDPGSQDIFGSDDVLFITNNLGENLIIENFRTSRRTDSFSLEFSVPVYKNVLLSLAANESQVDLGGDPNTAFQVGLSWNPVRWFNFRWNRSFGDRLPSPLIVGLDTFIEERSGFDALNITPVEGARVGISEPYYIIRGGVSDIAPERNTNDNLGINFNLRDYGLRVGINYSNNMTKNVVTERGLAGFNTGISDLFLQGDISRDTFDLLNDPEFQQAIGGVISNVDNNGNIVLDDEIFSGFVDASQGPQIIGPLEANRLVLDNRFINAGSREVENASFNITKTFDFEKVGRFTIAYNHNRVLTSENVFLDQCDSSQDSFCAEESRLSGLGTREFLFAGQQVQGSLGFTDSRVQGALGFGRSFASAIPEDRGTLRLNWFYSGLSTTLFTSFSSDVHTVFYDFSPGASPSFRGDYITGGVGVVQVSPFGDFFPDAQRLRNTVIRTTKAQRSVNLNMSYTLGSGLRFLDWIGDSGSLSLSINGLFEKPTKVIQEVIRREFTLNDIDAIEFGLLDEGNVPNGNFNVFNANPREKTYDLRYSVNF